MVEEAEGQGRIGATPGGRGGGGRREAPGASRELSVFGAGALGGLEVLSDAELVDIMQRLSGASTFIAEEAANARRMREEELDLELQNAASKERAANEAQADEKRRHKLELEEIEKESAERLKAINDSVFQALESAFASSVSAWLDGSKSMGEAALGMVRDVARALTTEAIVQGLKQTALGIGALAMGSPTAAGHFAAAAKWAAVGVAAGVVGASSGAFGGGGGGGGAPAAATGGPALTPGASEGAGTTVVINWGSSGLVYAADRAQLGRDISGMISEAHGRLGRGM
jgi:hypothetical protein